MGGGRARAQCIPNELDFSASGGTHAADVSALYVPAGVSGGRHAHATIPTKMPCNGPHCRQKPAHDESPPLPAPIPSAQVKDLASMSGEAWQVTAPPSDAPPPVGGDARPVARGRDIFHPPR